MGWRGCEEGEPCWSPRLSLEEDPLGGPGARWWLGEDWGCLERCVVGRILGVDVTSGVREVFMDQMLQLPDLRDSPIGAGRSGAGGVGEIRLVLVGDGCGAGRWRQRALLHQSLYFCGL